MSDYLLTIDPGMTGTGIATWDDGELQFARVITTEPGNFLVRVREIVDRVRPYSYTGRSVLEQRHIVIEQPQTYAGRAAKGDANDLIKLANLVGALSMLADEVELVTPAKWKGQAPASVVEARCRKKLTDVEKLRIELPRNIKHRTDVWHAIGLGLWKLGR